MGLFDKKFKGTPSILKVYLLFRCSCKIHSSAARRCDCSLLHVPGDGSCSCMSCKCMNAMYARVQACNQHRESKRFFQQLSKAFGKHCACQSPAQKVGKLCSTQTPPVEEWMSKGAVGFGRSVYLGLGSGSDLRLFELRGLAESFCRAPRETG